MPAPLKHAVLVRKLPAKVAPAADLLYSTRLARLELQKIVEALETQEKALKDFLINTLPKGEANGVTGKLARVEIWTKVIPTVADWDKFYAYVAKHSAFELLQRRLNESAVKERWEAGDVVPGTDKFTAVVVSCTKR